MRIIDVLSWSELHTTGATILTATASEPEPHGVNVGVAIVIILGVVAALFALSRVLLDVEGAIGALVGAGAGVVITVTAFVLLIVFGVVMA